MSVFVLSVGLVVRRGERTWRLERHLEDGTLVFVDQINGRPLSISVATLWRDVAAKRMSIVAGDAPVSKSIGDVPLIFDWNSLPQKLHEIAADKLKYVEPIRRLGLTRGMRKAIEKAISSIAERLEDDKPPSASTVMRCMRLMDDANGAPMAIVAKQLNRQRRSILPEKVLEVARQCLRSHYFTRKRPSLRQTKELIDRTLSSKVRLGEIDRDEAQISTSTLRRLCAEVDPYERDKARYGPNYARHTWRYSLGGSGVTRAMQRYEVDHTVVDMVVICERTGLPMGRPTITVVIDTFSGYVVGFYISFWGTGLATTLSALKVALTPKEIYTEGLELNNQWLGMGIPELLVVDNGLEFHSKQFWSVAAHLSIDLLYCAVRQPWLKGVVERGLGTYLNYFPSAGLVRKGITNEVPISPRDTAAVTFSSFCLAMLKTFVDTLPFEINERKLTRPYDLFSQSLEELPPPALPTCMEELEIIVAPSKLLTVGNEGVVSEYLRFNSHELQSLRRSTGVQFQTMVKFVPEDAGHVYVQDPGSHGWLPVPCTFPEYANGLSWIQHRAIRTHAKEHLKRINAHETLLQARAELLDLWQSSVRTGKKLKANQMRAIASLTSSQVFRLSEGASESRPVVVVPERFVSKEELSPTSRAIPEFESFVL